MDYPNIISASFLVDIWRVQYLLWEGNISSPKICKAAAKANPHVYASEYFKAELFKARDN